jgi:hypothetical protein
MVIYKCIKKFPGGPEEGTILQRGNHGYLYNNNSRLNQKEVENSPEYFTKITALVHSFKNQHSGNVYTLNIDAFPKLEYQRQTTVMSFDTCIQRYKIWSVIRIDDGDVYKVGKYALYNGHGQRPLKIEEFKMYKDGITPMVHYAGEAADRWYDDFVRYCSPFDYDDEEKIEALRKKANEEQEERFQKKHPISCFDLFRFIDNYYPQIIHRWERQHFYNFIKENEVNDN